MKDVLTRFRDKYGDDPTNCPSRNATNPCMIPPEGWICTRIAGHEGPCAAVPLLDLEVSHD